MANRSRSSALEGTESSVETTTIYACQEYVLRRIVLDVPITGFRDFITPWLISETGGRNILVDPGPSCGIASLTQALRRSGVSHLDLVLVTHIHIDHAGGTGLLLDAFPEAQVVVHPKGVPHLINPARLWASTVETLGDSLARSYGEISPVQESRILNDHPAPVGLEIVETLGHSPHHQSYIYTSPGGNIAFVGEAAGIHLGDEYLRPATPPRFFYETTTGSIETLRERLRDARLMLYGHYGHSGAPIKMLDAALDQMRLWKTVALDLVHEDPLAQVDESVRRAVTRLMKSDALLAGLPGFPPDVLERELYFLRNSARGFVLALVKPSAQLRRQLP